MSQLNVARTVFPGGIDVLYLRLSGVVDFGVASQVTQHIAGNQEVEDLAVAVDLSETSAIVGAGMRAIMDIYRRVGRKRLVLICKAGAAYDTLKWTGMTDLLGTLMVEDG